MANRKPLDPKCDGGVFCTVSGHITIRRFKNGKTQISHAPMTIGQRRTLMERKRTR